MYNEQNVQEKKHQLYVSNFSYQTTWQELKDLFKQAGNVARVETILKPNDKNYAIVLFEKAEEASRAVNMFNNYEFNGRVLLVRDQSQKHQRDDINMNKQGGGASKYGANKDRGYGSMGSMNGNKPRISNRDQMRDAPQQSTRLRDEHVSHTYDNQNRNPRDSQKRRNDDDRNVREDHKRSRPQFEGKYPNDTQNIAPRQQYNGAGRGNYRNDGMREAPVQTRLLINEPQGAEQELEEGSAVYVINVSFQATEDDLFQHFQGVGQIYNVKIFRHRDHKSKGCALVQYRSQREAAKAITQFSNTRLLGQKIQVREDQNTMKTARILDDLKTKQVSPSAYPRIQNNMRPQDPSYQPDEIEYEEDPYFQQQQQQQQPPYQRQYQEVIQYPHAQGGGRKYQGNRDMRRFDNNRFDEAQQMQGGQYYNKQFVQPQYMGGDPNEEAIRQFYKAQVYVQDYPSEFKQKELKSYMARAGQVHDVFILTSRYEKYNAIVQYLNMEDAERAIKVIDGKVVNNQAITVKMNQRPHEFPLPQNLLM